MPKTWEICETLQLAAECHSINKNQSLIKIRPVVPEKNAKNWENFETLQLAAEWLQHEQKSKIYQDETSRSYEQCKKLRNFATGCRVPQHEQKSKFDQDQTSSSWEKCKKVRKFWNFTIGCRVPQHKQKSKIYQDQTSSSWEKCQKLKKICETLQLAAECHSMNIEINVWWRSEQ